MRKVRPVKGLHAKVSDCIGAKPAVVSVKPLPEKVLARIQEKRARNSDVLDFFAASHQAFKSATPAHRQTFGRPLSQSVRVR